MNKTVVGDAIEPSCAVHRLFSLEGKTAIVTGASGGLGVRFAEVLHGAGANVVVVARRASLLEERYGGRDRFLPVRCDVASPEDRAGLVAAAVKRFGQVDILLNNAGIG